MEFIAETEEELKEISSEIFGRVLNSNKEDGATVVGLYGDLGSGKTTFTKYFAGLLGISPDSIISPTFIIQKRFNISENLFKLKGFEDSFTFPFKTFYHLDVYRIEDPSEVLSLDWKKIISDPQNLIVVEWADLIEKILPSDTLKINFETIDETSRKLIINF